MAASSGDTEEASARVAQIVVHVAPSGDDAAAGTAAAPLATLAAARDRIRKERKKPSDLAEVILHDGYHLLRSTLVLELKDAHTTWRAAPDSTPVIGSAVTITGWQLLKTPPAGLPQAAHGKVFMANLPEGCPVPVAAFHKGRLIERARSNGYTLPKSKTRKPKNLRTFKLPKGVKISQSDVRDVDVRVVPTWPWIVNLLPVKGITKSVLKTGAPATYGITGVRFGHFPNGHLWFENALPWLDKPGEWVVSSTGRAVYWWPPAGAPENFAIPTLTELVRVEGKIDYDGPTDTPVRDVHFRGLTFSHNDTRRLQPDKSGLGLQHDWEFFDAPTALVRMRGAEACSIEDCSLIDGGGTGIRLDLHAQKNRVVGNSIARLGGCGVLLAGYGPGIKDVNRDNIVSDNVIHNIGTVLWHSVGIFAWQSGHNEIVHNRIRNVPYSGIVVSGRIAMRDKNKDRECARTIRWHEVPDDIGWEKTLKHWQKREPYLHARMNMVAQNDISHCMELLGDGNAIYVSGCGKGNVVRGNHIHDIVTPRMNGAIRCDDDQHETIIEQNLIEHVVGEGIIIKGRNVIRNNLFVNITSKTANGEEAVHRRAILLFRTTPVDGSLVTGNVIVNSDSVLAPIDAKMPVTKTTFANNLWYCPPMAGEWKAYLKKSRKAGLEKGSQYADPGFVDLAKRDYRLRPDSVLYKMGLVPPDVSKAGPRRPPPSE